LAKFEREFVLNRAKVSVVMPVFGEAPFFEQAVESVLAQTCLDWELIVALDRPSRETYLLAGSLETKDPRITVLDSKTPGISDALNYAISNAVGDFICRLDADDVMLSTRLEVQIAAFKQNPQALCIGSQVVFIDESGARLGVSRYPQDDSDIRSALQVSNVIAHPSVLMRKRLFEAVGNYDPRFNGAEDYHLWLRTLNHGSILNLPDPLTFYRLHPQQDSKVNRYLLPALDSLARLDVLDGAVGLPNGIQEIRAWIRSLGGREAVSFIRNLEKKTQWSLRRALRFSRYLAFAGTSISPLSKLHLLTYAAATSPIKFLKIVSERVAARFA
jgi:glycosyltransferase involved in cell wall biosynthesis